MTLSPEDKAREVVRSLHEPLDLGKPYLETPMRKLMTEVIAQAIRDACNEKLEEAARELDLSLLANIEEAPKDWLVGFDFARDRVLALKDTAP